jgi:uncharacterized protein YqhQ
MGLYREEEEKRRGEERRKIEKRGKRRKNLFWLLIILFVSLVLSALTVTIPVLIEKFFNYNDESYRPMDIDRLRYELEKEKAKGAQK